ncbi:MAG TPA: anhydro-N-acetylmuramic acid kinase [Cyclobacteriaceae bacterium]|nr:anhydro-N-acetylmuramic acid kinase [Cyclobacteriaceae bacterium]HMV08293.1 anhydro-N-acetylmuramic acid kinase [Cyclobacteriaceae bacterium]HMV88430.1 anhydro-N-acetylmuramic acid kinase [Cyclobacteriaceae bacterium]HMX02136.1 anhydro-N-acetylmuramic acid kinase [Cyclobacteriaceae bacterium]HMX49888.1 anhydro-N-acetylmuramic acid kinase [Cyclobacteriaceae bacterium]
MNSTQIYKVIGLMSGTSLDGVDIAYCTFRYNNGWSFELEAAQTISYAPSWNKKLMSAHALSAEQLLALDAEYGTYLGTLCNAFIKKHKIKELHFIASHGHTIFHQPENKFTFQLGNGNAIHAASSLPVICDFRSLDVLYGGQGAPLVPVGDQLLFHDYDACLNLGGIANLSLDYKKERLAYDVCFLNMGLNHLAQKMKKKFDANGAQASSGEVNKTLLRRLDKVYSATRVNRPSLGREMFEAKIKRLLDDTKISTTDKLRTFTESAAAEIVTAFKKYGVGKTVLCSGGGAFNSFLIYRMVELAGDDITFVIPDDYIINFKEAIVFAFLGVLRIRNEANSLKSVTGASRNSSGGVMVGF